MFKALGLTNQARTEASSKVSKDENVFAVRGDHNPGGSWFVAVIQLHSSLPSSPPPLYLPHLFCFLCEHRFLNTLFNVTEVSDWIL